MELPLNYRSLTSYSYKIQLNKCLIKKALKICSNWNSFHNYIERNIFNLIKITNPSFLIDKTIKTYPNNQIN